MKRVMKRVILNMNTVLGRLRSGQGHIHRACRSWMSDYSDTFRGRELAEERFWIRKHEQEVASLQSDPGPEKSSGSESSGDNSASIGNKLYPSSRAAVPGSVMYAHQANQVVALEELEEILEAFSGRSAGMPEDLKKVLVDWKVAALYEPSVGPEQPWHHAPSITESGALVKDDRHVLPVEYAPSWLLEEDATKYKFLRYAYDQMIHDHDVEPIERHIDRDEHFRTIKRRVLEKADPKHDCPEEGAEPEGTYRP